MLKTTATDVYSAIANSEIFLDNTVSVTEAAEGALKNLKTLRSMYKSIDETSEATSIGIVQGLIGCLESLVSYGLVEELQEEELDNQLLNECDQELINDDLNVFTELGLWYPKFEDLFERAQQSELAFGAVLGLLVFHRWAQKKNPDTYKLKLAQEALESPFPKQVIPQEETITPVVEAEAPPSPETQLMDKLMALANVPTEVYTRFILEDGEVKLEAVFLTEPDLKDINAVGQLFPNGCRLNTKNNVISLVLNPF